MSDDRDAVAFRRWMARFATGVTVVTAREGERSFGLTVNAFLSVSLNPPLVLISLTRDADTTPVIRKTGRFAVSILSAKQGTLSERFAATEPPEAKFAQVPTRSSPGGLPWLADALGWMECAVEESREVADHVLFLGRVVTVEPGGVGTPLVFFEGGYFSTNGTALERVPPK